MDRVQRLPDEARLLFYLQACAHFVFFWLPALTVVGALLAATWSFQGALTVAGGLTAVRLVVVLVGPWLSWSAWGWRIHRREILIERGVFFKSVSGIPMERVQHVDVRQGPLERALGLAQLHIHTASGVGSDGVIPGLERSAAESLRDQLLEEVDGDDGV